MKIVYEIDPKIEDDYIYIKSNKNNSDVEFIINSLNNKQTNVIGYSDNKAYILEIQNIEKIYTESSKVFASYQNNKYELKNRLYEIENILSSHSFIRISNAELVNINEISNLDLKITGTIVITMKSGRKSYCSRRRIPEFKKILNIK